jgi:hypothetical protein
MEPIRLIADREFNRRFLVTVVTPGELDRSGGPEMAGLYYPAKDVDERIKVLEDALNDIVQDQDMFCDGHVNVSNQSHALANIARAALEVKP